ncbi:DUF1801 domain-containing protein [Neotamlana laminarinivorans]|uniref:DUF1801 domain-containing protein n=1 Tax=Neotamlana laminarinivorans TaxID=2883124 RepID=A0A9X1L4N3_9FLAO|nr:DUF1801 domain-containing protein [Tamlana laminarinivorans]MCB4799512.1 DUF1801 domain-containing protein [Tamlana laminarinivorans]
MQIVSHPKVTQVFNNYPEHVKPKMDKLRCLVLQTASEIKDLKHLEETLKWGEPSYLTKNGSTLRIDWKPKTPNQYAMYFQCTTQLVSTFKILYKNTLTFQANRAIIFNLNSTFPELEIKQCITLALTYHKVKHIPLLGM